MMKLSKKRIFLTAYIIGIFLIFLYLAFPSESVKTYLANQLSGINPDIRVTIERVKPALPPAVRLLKVDLYHQERFWGSIEDLKIVPRLSSLFGSETAFSFKGNAYAGRIKGNAEIESNSAVAQMSVHTTLTGIQVKDVQAIRDVSDYKISGLLDATLAYKSDVRKQTLKGTLTLSGCRVDFAAPLFNQKFFTFKDVRADVVLDNQTLTIQHCRLTGNQLDASISGSVISNRRTAKTALNLNATLTPHSILWAQLKKSPPFKLLTGGMSAGQSFSFKIRGTVDAPEISLK